MSVTPTTTGEGTVLPLDTLAALEPCMQRVAFAAGDCIFAEGSPSDSFYLIESGEVRLEVRTPEVDSDKVLAYSGPGSFLGEVGVLGGAPRSATAIAHTDLVAHRVGVEDLDRLYDDDPKAGLAVVKALGRDTAAKLLRSSAQVAHLLPGAGRDPEVDRMVAAAVAAQQEFERWPEARVDALLRDIAESFAARAEELAHMATDETGIGNVPDKVVKIRFGSLGVYAVLAGKPGYGPIGRRRDPLRHTRLPIRRALATTYRILRARPETARRLPQLLPRPRTVTELASPVGVVFGLVPLTEPSATFVNKTLICLKARDAVILSCHRLSQGIADRCGEIVHEALRRHRAPVDLVQWVRGRTSREKTARFMHHEDIGLILATGGASMVKAAYSAGKPAIGVGTGNAPAWICPDADLDKAARDVIDSKNFDYGLICGSEQHLVVDRSVREPFVAALRRHGAAVLDVAQTERFVSAAFDPVTTDLLLELIGKPAGVIAEATGLGLDGDVSLLVFEADARRPEGAVARERLAPVVSLFTVEGDDEAIALCQKILANEGTGHTAVIHTRDEARVTRFGAEIPASRILVNVPAAQGCGGVVTGLLPSFTLGCGTFGGNSTTDNVGYGNLLNIKRVARAKYANASLLASFEPAYLAEKLAPPT